MSNTIKSLGGVGILSEEDLSKFTGAMLKIVALMGDGEWYSATEIIKASEQREGLRRLRQLRGFGFKVERKRGGSRREFHYRLVIPAKEPACKATQQELL
jgi:hypothetical protein